MEPTLKQLHYMVAVADHLNFRRAADACFVSQPALSEQIRLLEEILGIQLFERDKKHVLVTEAGGRILERARKLMRDHSELVTAAKSYHKPFSSPLRMGVIPTIAPYLLPHILTRIYKKHPQLKLYLREEKTDVQIDSILHGKLDLSLLALPIDQDQLEVRELYQEDFVLVTMKDHPLQAKKKLLQSDLVEHRILLLDEGHCLRDQALEICNLAGASEHQELRASSLNTLVQMVANGLGITLLPKLAVHVEVRSNPILAFKEFSSNPPFRKVGLIWRKQSARREELEFLYHRIMNNMPKLVQDAIQIIQ